MSGNDKKIIEQNSHGEFELTAYGEFLSYFHTHIQLFNGLISGKKISPTDQEALKQKVRSYIVNNIQKTEQFFDHLPKFAEFLGMSQADLSAFMTKNFMNTHAGIQNKLIEQEKANINKPRKKKYSRISEEIVETIGVLVPPGKRFIGMDGYVVLRDEATGKDLEPAVVPSFGETTKSTEEGAASTVKKTAAPTPAAPLRKPTEKLILTEIVERFGSEFSGNPLVLKKQELDEEEVVNNLAVGGNEELLTEVEDLQFGGYDEPTFPEEESFEPPVEPEEPPVIIPFSKYMESVNRVRQFQKDGQPDAYKKWVMTLPPELSALVQLHSFVLKEMKNEPVDWNTIIASISSRIGLKDTRLWKVLDLTRSFAELRAGLEKAFVTSKTVGLEELVKRAWPHILKIFEEYPDTSSLRQKLDQLFTRIPDPTQRKKLSDLFLPVIQKL